MNLHPFHFEGEAAVIDSQRGAAAEGPGFDRSVAQMIEGPVGAFSYATRPVKPGEVVELYGVGFGPTNPAVPAGQAFSVPRRASQHRW